MEIRTKLNVNSVNTANKTLQRMLDKALKAATVDVAARVITHIQTELIPNTAYPPVDRGVYRAAWKKSGSLAGPGGSPGTLIIYNATPYAPIIEYGARAQNIKPGKAMIDALASWAQRKLHVAAHESKGVAFAIVHNMKKRGIFGPQGLRIAQRARKTFLPQIPEIISEHIRAVAGTK